jgi:hypothetical protein
MPRGIINTDVRIFFCLIVSRTFSDKEAHNYIIHNYIIELKIAKSNSMESHHRDILRHLKQYKNTKGTESKQITNTIIKQYRKINEPAFLTGLNTNIILGPTEHKYRLWIVNVIKWTIETIQDLISRNLWPKTEVAANEEITTMPMHQTSGEWISNKNPSARTSRCGGGASP